MYECLFALLLCVTASCFADPAGTMHPHDYINTEIHQNCYENGWVYRKKNDGTALIVDYVKHEVNIVIPDKICGLTVTELGGDLFSWSPIHPVDMRNVRSIFIPATVVFINNIVFNFYSEDNNYFIKLIVAEDNPVYETVNGGLYNKVEKSLHTVFQYESDGYSDDDDDVKIKFVVKPGTKILAEQCFPDGTPVIKIYLPDSLEEIAMNSIRYYSHSFSDTIISIPAGVKKINPYNTFSKNVTIVTENPYYEIYDGCLYDKVNKEMISTVQVQPEYTIKNGTKKVGCFTVDVVSVTIPDSVTSLGTHAFDCDGVRLEKPLSKNISYIGPCCFPSEPVIDPDNKTYCIKNHSLYNKISDTLVSVYKIARNGSYTVPEGTKVIGSGAFNLCEETVRSVNIPETVKRFAYCGNTVRIPASVKEIPVVFDYEGDMRTTYEVVAGSAAEEWAKESNLPYKVVSLYETTVNLRLRKTQDSSSEVLTTMSQGTPVTIRSEGKEAIIDGIHGKWMFVELPYCSCDKDGKEIPCGTTGWCFSGYLVKE